MRRLLFWLLLLCAAGVPVFCQATVRKVDPPAEYSRFQPGSLHALVEGIVLTGSAEASTGEWRPLLLFVSDENEYRSHREVPGSGSELLVDSVDDGRGLYLLSNLRGSGAGIQSMKISSVSPEGGLSWSSIVGGQGFANAGDISYDAQSATVAALGWINDGDGEMGPSFGGWDILVALFEPGGRRRWLSAAR
jgi:hypothetical protein